MWLSTTVDFLNIATKEERTGFVTYFITMEILSIRYNGKYDK